MDEFVNRMNKQRQILRLINNNFKKNEELSGLSEMAILRWLNLNGLSPIDQISVLLLDIAEKLNFLACESQNQISEEYKSRSSEINSLVNELSKYLNVRV